MHRLPELRRRLAIVLFATLPALTALAFGSTNFTVPPGRQAEPNLVVMGPDHNLWFTEFTGEKIGRITTAGVITEFTITGCLLYTSDAADE